jgi:hypothetical protein
VVYAELQIGLLFVEYGKIYRKLVRPLEERRKPGPYDVKCRFSAEYYCSDPLGQALAPDRDGARAAFHSCTEYATHSLYWDDNASECERQFAKLDRTVHALDELLPAPRWVGPVIRGGQPAPR